MKRDYNIDPYINTVKDNDLFFKQYYFHSIIDLNLIKLDYILKHGLLSRKNIEKNNLLSFYVHSIRSYDCKNGNDYISLIDYNMLFEKKGKCEFHKLFEAFALHTLTSLSIMIDRNIEVFSKGILEPAFDDEIFALDSIDTSHISGIILPEHLACKHVSEIPFLPGDPHCYTKRNIEHLLDCMESYFNKTIEREEIYNSLNEIWDICDKEYSNPSWITAAVKIQKERYGIDIKDVLAKIMNDLWSEKLNIYNLSYLDVINRINNDVYPVYVVKEKTLKKIN